jgi:hypothetical protein
MATSAVAAAAARARREVQHHFFSHDAVRPERAVPFDAESRMQQRQFERMRSSGVIREGSPGAYWLDVVAYDSDLRRRHAQIRTLLLVVLVIVLIPLIVTAIGFPLLTR